MAVYVTTRAGRTFRLVESFGTTLREARRRLVDLVADERGRENSVWLDAEHGGKPAAVRLDSIDAIFEG